MNSRGGETFLFSKFIEGGKRVQAAPKAEGELTCIIVSCLMWRAFVLVLKDRTWCQARKLGFY